jgi:hypothetical protein
VDACVDAERFEQGRQDFVRLAVHEVDPPRHFGRARRRAAVTGPRVDEAAALRGVADALREILPHRNRPQPFMQEHDERRTAALRRDPPVLDAHAPIAPGDLDELGTGLSRAVHAARFTASVSDRAACSAGSCQSPSSAVRRRTR